MANPFPLFRSAGPVLVFGGPYSNLEATQAVLAEAARRGVPDDHLICTGDIIAYGADAAATLDLVRKRVSRAVLGNCEESLAARAPNCGCGFPAGSACERLSSAWFGHADRQIQAEMRLWMARLPRRLDVEIGGLRFAVLHGGVKSINQFIFASTAGAIKDQELGRAGVDGIIAGHCGLPFSQDINGRLWHNAGVIGMPANDGTARVWFSIISPRPDGISIEHRAVEYDHRAAAEKMRGADLPEGYAAALETGLWPSCDVLPLKEIRERGVPLEEGCAVWRRSASRALPARKPPIVSQQLWPSVDTDATSKLDPRKFRNPHLTVNGEPRARVALRRLKTLWFNTGTLCNISCRNCYIESSPMNDRLVYLKRNEVAAYLDEIGRDGWDTEEIGFTGGEPFMNSDFVGMLEDCLSRGFRALVLTNAMRPMQRRKQELLDLSNCFGDKLIMRVSLDHFTPERHEDERGPGTFKPTLRGLLWLARSGFKVAVAGRTMWGDDPEAERAGYARLFADHGIPIDAEDPAALVLFPEMDPRSDVPEITEACWNILGKSPQDVMCASSRMVGKRKGAEHPAVLACTLIPYDDQFELGPTLKDAARQVALNHPNCAKFCVLGGASCSPATSAKS